MNYYYLLASMPSLQAFAEPPIAREAFLQQANQELTSADRRELDAVLAGAGVSAFAARLRAFEARLGLLVARIRAERRGFDASELPPDDGVPDLDLVARVLEAFAGEDPMDRQRRLDRIVWRWLEEQAAADSFGASAVFAYALRLDLLHRWDSRSAMRGHAALHEQREKLLAGFGGMPFSMDTGTFDKGTEAGA